MATSRIEALKSLRERFEPANQRMAQGRAAAQAYKLQRAQLPRGPAATAEIAGAAAREAGERQLEEAAQRRQREAQVGELALQETGRQAEQRQFERGIELRRENLRLNSEIAKLGRDAREELFESRNKLYRDRMGRTYLNERQLADVKIAEAVGEEKFRDWAQEAEQQHSRRLQILQAAHAKISQTMEQGYLRRKGDLDQQAKLELAERKRQIEEKMAREKADMQQKAAMWEAGGTVIGAAAGTLIPIPGLGTAAGAAAGATAGKGLGRALGSIF